MQKKLKNLKDNLKKCLNKRNSMTRSGAAASSLPMCKFFDEMAFLHEKSFNPPSERNLDPGILQIDAENVPPKITEVTPRPCKRSNTDDSDLILKELSNFDNEIKKVMADNKCEDSLYCQSLVPILKLLPLRKKRQAKIKISQLLYEIEFDEQCE